MCINSLTVVCNNVKENKKNNKDVRNDGQGNDIVGVNTHEHMNMVGAVTLTTPCPI